MDIQQEISDIRNQAKVILRESTFPIVIPGKYLTKEDVTKMYSENIAEKYSKLSNKERFSFKHTDKLVEYFAFDGKIYYYFHYCEKN